jgi:hypothetical protein
MCVDGEDTVKKFYKWQKGMKSWGKEVKEDMVSTGLTYLCLDQQQYNLRV